MLPVYDAPASVACAQRLRTRRVAFSLYQNRTLWDCQRLQPCAEFGSARRKPNGLCPPDLPEILYQSDRKISRKKPLDVINNLRYYLVT